MKIYCILNDSMPLGNKLELFLKVKGLHHFTQFSNCFTTTSVTSLLTGKLPSDLEAGGIAYGSHSKYITEGKVNWPWKESLRPYQLHKEGWEIECHNAMWFYHVMSSDEFIKHTFSTPCDLLTESDFRKTPEYAKQILNLNSDYYKKEKEYIKKIQSEKGNKFYFIKNNQFHEHIVSKNTDKNLPHDLLIEWFNWWDLNEEGALFWIFSDHHNFVRIDKYCTPPCTLTWAFVKDNALGLKPNRNYIQISDFYDLKSIEQEVDKNRIYFAEDARSFVDELNNTTAIAGRFTDWAGNKANTLLQVTYFKPEKKYYGYKYDLQRKRVTQTIPYSDLQQAIRGRFKWL